MAMEHIARLHASLTALTGVLMVGGWYIMPPTTHAGVQRQMAQLLMDMSGFMAAVLAIAGAIVLSVRGNHRQWVLAVSSSACLLMFLWWF